MWCCTQNLLKIGLFSVLVALVLFSAAVVAVPNFNVTKHYQLSGSTFVQGTPTFDVDTPIVQIGTSVETPFKSGSQGGTLEVTKPGIRGSSSSTTNTTGSIAPIKMLGLQVSTFGGPEVPTALGMPDPVNTSFAANPQLLQASFAQSGAFKAATPVLPKSGGITEKTTSFGSTVAAVKGPKAYAPLKTK